jgi:hypothetical protein
MPRAAAIRAEIHRMIRAVPYRPFALNLENGDRVIIEHPENIAFDPDGGTDDFYVISGQLRLFSTFAAVTNVATLDRDEGRRPRGRNR